MIELRYEEGSEGGYLHLDELVGKNCTVHLERMDGHWFCLIVEDGERRVMLNVGAKKARVRAGVYEDCGVEPVTTVKSVAGAPG